jgi:hypothetical protein
LLVQEFLIASVHFLRPHFVRAKRGKTAAVPLTVAERTLGSSLKGATYCSMMRWPSIQKDKASISTGLRRAEVCQSLGAALCLVMLRRTTNADVTASVWCNSSKISNRIAAAWNADTQQGTHGSRGALLNGGHSKRKSETQRPLPHGA